MYRTGEIENPPNMIYWAEMPNVIGEEENLELLKNDIFLIRYNLNNPDDLEKLSKLDSENSAYFFNLDKIIRFQSLSRTSNTCYLNNLLQCISNFKPHQSLIHTTLIDDKLANTIKSFGIPYIEKNLQNRKQALTTVTNLIKPFFSDKGQVKKAKIRMNFKGLEVKCKLIRKAENERVHNAYLRDLSLNGASMLLDSDLNFEFFNLKDIVKVELYLKPHIIIIHQGFVCQLDRETRTAKICFNVNDNRMVHPNEGDKICRLFYKWLKEIYPHEEITIN
ncbi:MAG: hypothetical protein MJB14_01905 [Spirochaetes bacterium]|nr:hypothetical protein [Spirochaetota bacterium]